MSCLINKRFTCPCCGYPTLDEKDSYDICLLCDWEDDGQDDLDADYIRGGPNGNYSLTEVRENFIKYLIMYSPGRDKRLTGGDTKEEVEVKKQLIIVYEDIAKEKDSMKIDKLWILAYGLEDRLYKITSDKIKEYENNLKKIESSIYKVNFNLER